MNVNSHLHPMPETVGDLREILAKLPVDMPVVVSSHGLFHIPAVETQELSRCEYADADGDFEFVDGDDDPTNPELQRVLVLYR